MIRESCRRFLTGQAHADSVRHSGRSLYEHLCGTHDLLQEWGNRDAVCAAGLFHSIYGTRYFRHRAWPLADRRTIMDLIGVEAEALAYTFCTSDRPRAFLDSNIDFAANARILTPSLREIEAANLIEQGSRSHWLQRLHDSDISDGARRAIAGRMKHACPVRTHSHHV
jgi:hypothetical protein